MAGASPIDKAIESVKQLMKEHKVVVFSKTTCGFCSRVKRVLGEYDIDDLLVVELNERPDGDDMQSALKSITGQRTVPNVIINNKHVGGCDDTMALHKSGQLGDLIRG